MPSSAAKPLAFYIHWPFCRSKCPYCDFNSHVHDRVDQPAWREALLREMEWMAQHTAGRQVESIFFGGGTPSLMPPVTVAALLDAAAGHWMLAEDAEITLEANPTSVEASAFTDFRQAGVNRVSLGVQALRDDALKFLGRQHDAAEALKAVALAAHWFPRYSFDLIYARPQQSAAAWAAELTEALSHARGHLSLYQLTIEENTAFHHVHARGEFSLPNEEESAELYTLTQEIMDAASLPAYEVSNHARPGEESQHNLAYWRGGDYAGIGPGAHGRLTLAGERVATATLKSPQRWQESVMRQGHGVELWQPLDERTHEAEALMMRLRLTGGFARDELPFLSDRSLGRLRKEGLLTPDATRVQTTLKGRLLLNYVAAELLAA